MGVVDHEDRGDGTCGYCYESWPCEGSRTGDLISGVIRYEHEQRMERHLQESIARVREWDYVIAVFDRFGVPLGREIHKFRLTVTLSREKMKEIATRVDEACGYGVESSSSPAETIDEEEEG